MQEKNAQHMRNGYITDSVHERLTDFYGPQRPAQQLPLDAWLAVRYRLGKQDTCIPFLFWRPSLRPAPSSIQVAFRQIVREVYGAAVTNRGVPMLYARFKMHLRQPGVHVPLLRNNLLLTLPSAPNITEDRAALDVLLTVGLARYLLTREWRYRWIYLLMLFLPLADGTTLVLANLYQQWIILLIMLIATVSLVRCCTGTSVGELCRPICSLCAGLDARACVAACISLPITAMCRVAAAGASHR